MWAIALVLALTAALLGRPTVSWALDETGPAETPSIGQESAGETSADNEDEQSTSFSVALAWYDDETTRPDEVTIRLLADGIEAESATLTSANVTDQLAADLPEGYSALWLTSFEDLPATQDGSPISYSVSQDPVDGYECTSFTSGDLQVFLNTAMPSEPEPALSLDGAQIVLDEESFVYDGSPKEPSVTVKLDDEMVDPANYQVSYVDNTNAGTATVMVTGTDPYEGSASAAFAIAPKPIELVDFTLSKTSYTYDGTTKKPGVTKVMADEVELTSDDYDVSYAAGRKTVGTYDVTVMLRGNYTGSASKTFTITKCSLAKATIGGIKAKTYSGASQTQAVSVTLDGKKLAKDKDYSVSYANNKNAGTATITIKGKGNYTGSVKKSFKIAPKSIAKATVSGIKNKTYNGSAQTQAPVVKISGKTLAKSKDYTLSYKNNKNAGTATVTIKGKGNYTGSIKKSFKIAKRDFAKVKVSSIAKQLYTGSALKPAPMVKWGSTKLKNGTDYTVSYKNNVKLGKATVTIKGKGNYTSKTKTCTFTIYQAAISSARVQVDSTSVDWNGSAQKPGVTITYGGKTLRQGTDYTVKYSNNVNPGSANIVITGKRGFTGTVTKHFTITKGGTVYLTKTGDCYHCSWCSSLRRSSIPTTLYDARRRGYRPCSNCNP